MKSTTTAWTLSQEGEGLPAICPSMSELSDCGDEGENERERGSESEEGEGDEGDQDRSGKLEMNEHSELYRRQNEHLWRGR
jgi:hypothetical protein